MKISGKGVVVAYIKEAAGREIKHQNQDMFRK